MAEGLLPDESRGGIGSRLSGQPPQAHVQLAPPPVSGQQQAPSIQPVPTTCPSCQHEVITETVSRPGLLAWTLVGIMCLLGLWLCCLFPLCLVPCHDIDHRCPSCKTRITTVRRM